MIEIAVTETAVVMVEIETTERREGEADRRIIDREETTTTIPIQIAGTTELENEKNVTAATAETIKENGIVIEVQDIATIAEIIDVTIATCSMIEEAKDVSEVEMKRKARKKIATNSLHRLAAQKLRLLHPNHDSLHPI